MQISSLKIDEARPLLRLPDVKKQFSRKSDAQVYADIADGVLPRPVKLGSRVSAWPIDEISAILCARIAGAGDEEIRELVATIHARRRGAWADLRFALGIGGAE